MPVGDRILIIFVFVAIPVIFIGVPIFVFSGGIQKFARGPLQRCFAGLKLHQTPQPGDVSVVYHTYRGFLIWFVQEEHRIYASRAQATKLLGRLLRFNLTWGLMSYGLFFVPFLAIGNYFTQKSSIAQQNSNGNSVKRRRKR